MKNDDEVWRWSLRDSIGKLHSGREATREQALARAQRVVDRDGWSATAGLIRPDGWTEQVPLQACGGSW